MTAYAIEAVSRGGQSLRSFFASLVHSVSQAREQRRSYDAIMNELLRLDEKEMNGLGLSRADFHAIASGTFNRPLDR